MTEGGEGGGKGVSVNVALGQEIDRAAGGVLAELLRPPATELGRIFGDGLGLLADPLRRKRELNAQIGLQKVRAKLADAGLSPEDAQSPKPEELHLLVQGMSLTDDESVQDLWAGLFAKAVEPSSSGNPERPYIKALENLTALDAGVIDFLAMMIRHRNEMNEYGASYRLEDPKNPTLAEKEDLQRIREGAKDMEARFEETLVERHDELSRLNGGIRNSLINLFRLGLVEGIPNPVSKARFAPANGALGDLSVSRVLEDFGSRIEDLSDVAIQNAIPPAELIKMSFSLSAGYRRLSPAVRFTPFGRNFAQACGLF